MERLKKFDNFLNEETNEDLVAVGFGAPNMAASWNMNGAMRSKATGYSFTPIAGKVRDLAQGIAQQGQNYESNNNTDHSGTAYIKEAKDHIGNAIDETYNSMTAQSESEAVTEEYVEIINIDDALEDMKTGWDNWKGGPLTEPSDIKPAAKEFKAYITGWMNKNIK